MMARKRQTGMITETLTLITCKAIMDKVFQRVCPKSMIRSAEICKMELVELNVGPTK